MEAKDLLSYMGIEATDMDDFKSKFTDKYAGDEKQAASKWLKPMMGEKLGKVKQNILKKAREEGIDFTQNEFDDKDIEEIHGILADRKSTKFKTELESLRAKAGANGDDVVKELQEKYEKASKRASEEEKLRKELAGEFDTFKSHAANEVKGVKINYLKQDKMSKLKLKAGLSDLEKTGFESYIEKNYKFDFDDTGKEFVMDATGNRIRSAKKADEYKSIDEVLTETAATFKILAENPQAGKPAGMPFNPTTGQAAPPPIGGNPPPLKPNNTGRKVNPMFDNY